MDIEIFVCDICDKKFHKKRNLRAHERRHVVPKTRPCETCGQVFTDAVIFQHHLQGHSSKPMNECGICHKLFTRKTTLDCHMRLHTNDKKYQCQYCGKCNGTKYDLHCHLRTHTGEKPYQCEVCNPPSSFTTRSSLMRHMRTHSGYQPHVCKWCDKTFYRKDQYNRHMNKHMEYRCLGCGAFFVTYAKYSKHSANCSSVSDVDTTAHRSGVAEDGTDERINNVAFEIPLLDETFEGNAALFTMQLKDASPMLGDVERETNVVQSYDGAKTSVVAIGSSPNAMPEYCIKNYSTDNGISDLEEENDSACHIVHIMIEQDPIDHTSVDSITTSESDER